MATWTDKRPMGNDLLSTFPSLMTSQAVALRTGLERHSFWTDSSGLSAGVPRLSEGSFGPGSARAFFDIESNASSVFSTSKAPAGRLYVTSDTTRLIGYTSTATVKLGGGNVIVYIGASLATIPSNTRVLVQTGASHVTAGGLRIAFPTPYTATAPVVQATALSASTANFALVSVSGTTVGGSNLSYTNVFGAPSFVTILWRSHGTVTL